MSLNRIIAIAPMMDWTDRHCRYFMRLLSQHTLLYTEMVTTGALLHQDPARWLRHDPSEHPLALQLGGSNPQDLAKCAILAENFGFQEVNLNVGCPSNRVQEGRFGACLMAEPGLVANCLAAMQEVVTIPVTIKTRIGIDQHDSYKELQEFIAKVSESGCKTFIIHARKAWLKGLNPKQNREIPPLRYAWVWQIKQDFPHLTICLNGGITQLAEISLHLQHVDGVMLGREAYHNPYLLAELDQRFYGSLAPIKSRYEVIEALLPYLEAEMAKGIAVKAITRHILGLFQGLPGARQWRRILSCHDQKDNISVIDLALAATRQQNS